MRDRLGIAIIILAFGVSAISPYWIIFLIPIFLIGVVIFWTTKRTIKQKLLWTILPIAIWFPTVYFFMYSNGKLGKWTAQKFDFVFANKFQGRAVVIGDMPCGQPINIKDGREVLTFPDNGVLLYQGKIESGYINHKYFQADSLGNNRELSELGDYMFWDDAKHKPSTSSKGVFIGEFGTRGNTEQKNTSFKYLVLTLTSKDGIDSFRQFKYIQTLENKIDSLVTKCRE